MIHKMSNSLSECLIKENLIEADLKENYSYAIETICEKWITYAAIFLSALYFQTVIPTLLFLLFFLSLRRYSGGLHMPSFGGCLIGTVMIYICFNNWGYPFLEDNARLMYTLVSLSVGFIMIVGTVNHPNMNLDCKEFKACKKSARIMVILEAMSILLFIILNFNMAIIVFAAFGVILCAVLLFIGKIIEEV